MPEGLLWLLLTGDVSCQRFVACKLPAHVKKVIEALPDDAHPMTQFTTAVMALQTSSKYAKAYADGIHKSKYWDPTYEDSMDLIAKLPEIAAIVSSKNRNLASRVDGVGLPSAMTPSGGAASSCLIHHGGAVCPRADLPPHVQGRQVHLC